MSATAAVADHLDSRTDSILAHWRATVERQGDVPQAGRLTYREFLDHVPELLDTLAERLRGRGDSAAHEGREHGIVRWRQGFDVTQIVAELGHLRTTLLRATLDFAARDSLDPEDLAAALLTINDVINEATAESVRRSQEAAQLRSQAVLAQVEERRLAVEGEQARQKAILEALPVGVWILDAAGGFLQVNPEAERLQGFPADRAIGRVRIGELRPSYRLSRLDGTDYADSEVPGARALGGEVVQAEPLVIRRDEGDLVIVVSAAPLRGPDGAIAGAVVVANDYTERQRIEGELAEARARLEAIVEQTPVMIWRCGVDGRCEYFNGRWLEFRGRSLAEEIAAGPLAAVHPDDHERVRGATAAAIGRRAPLVVEYRLLRADGQYRWITDHGTPTFDARGRFAGYLGSCIDITERVDFEGLLAEQKQAAEARSLHKTRLMSALSHDARTPLHAVVLSAQLLELHLNGLADPEVADSLTIIRRSVTNVLDLLGDLLNLTRLEEGVLPAETARFAIEPAMAEVLAGVTPQARRRGLAVRHEPGPLADLEVETDRAKLKQILANLLSNALRYTDRGHIRMAGDRRDGALRIAVEDTGPGIDPAQHERIFEEFARLEPPTAADGRAPAESEGSGLGLSICRRLAGLLGGRIELTSAPGQGSTFTVVLPDSIVVGQADNGATAARADARPGPDAGAILVAEDHEGSRRALAKLLRRLGHEVVEAADGREAVRLAFDRTVCAVLLDVNMPLMDGVEVAALLRADPRTAGLPIFALTGDVGAENRRRIAAAGVDGFLEKPVAPDALLDALRSIADRRR